MNFPEVQSRLDEHIKLIDRLRQGQIDLLTVSRVENLMVRDMVIFVYTEYQRGIVKALLEKVKFHSNNHEAIVNFVRNKIEKTNIDVKTLTNLLRVLLPQYASNFALAATSNRKSEAAYRNLVEARINVAHEQGNNLQIGSLYEVRETHESAKHLLDSFESCMW